MRVITKTFKNKSCCGDHTLYKLDKWDKDSWLCADDMLRELMDKDYHIGTEGSVILLKRILKTAGYNSESQTYTVTYLCVKRVLEEASL